MGIRAFGVALAIIAAFACVAIVAAIHAEKRAETAASAFAIAADPAR